MAEKRVERPRGRDRIDKITTRYGSEGAMRVRGLTMTKYAIAWDHRSGL